MTVSASKEWTVFEPKLESSASRSEFLKYARALARLSRAGQDEEATEELRSTFVEDAKASGAENRPLLLAAGLVLADLAVQGWGMRIRNGSIEVSAPPQLMSDRAGEKARVRRQELVKRDAQIRQPAVRAFLASMERAREFKGRFTSIFSVMRDGRELAQALKQARAHRNNGWADALIGVVDPYLVFVSEEGRCPHTGLRLMDMWRYFRHTWSNQYTSVPGRTMMFIVRDRAAAFHPVVGIGAISSPVMQIRERDSWIGWQPEVFLAEVKNAPTIKVAHWLVTTVREAIAEIFIDDFLEEGVFAISDLGKPNADLISRLLVDSSDQRRLHHRYARAREHKGSTANLDPGHWAIRARTHLFRSKRALALATFLRARLIIDQVFGTEPTVAELQELISIKEGSDAIRKVLRKAKADRIGIAVADLTVCGAVQPYNAILGGKLVAMLAAGPEVVLEYQRRYGAYESEIASSIAGRAIVRPSRLVLLGTTSLYGVGSSQYNRIKIPCNRLGGLESESISYAELGRSEAFGTSQYSDETVDALTAVVQQSANGQRVNSIFGEGVSPKLRKVRQGLETLNLPSDALLRHHRQRIVYGVSLVRNLKQFLLGLEEKPNYLAQSDNGASATAQIAAWWRERWLLNRIASDDVLEATALHTLVRPISHGARVSLPTESDKQLSLV